MEHQGKFQGQVLRTKGDSRLAYQPKRIVGRKIYQLKLSRAEYEPEPDLIPMVLLKERVAK